MERLPLLPGIKGNGRYGEADPGVSIPKQRTFRSQSHKRVKMGIFAEDLIFDPQTPEASRYDPLAEQEQELLRQLHDGGFDRSVRIGKFVEGGKQHQIDLMLFV